MGRPCSICSHPKRIDIECDILSSVPFRAISEKYQVGRAPVQRHLENGHIAQATIKAQEVRKIAYSEDLLEKLFFLQHEALKILVKAKNPEEGKPLLNTALSAIGKAASLLETQAKLAGQLRDMEINIAVHPLWLAIKEEIFSTLKAFPAAQKALIEAVGNGKLTDVQKRMLERDRVTPGVLAIINKEYESEEEGEQLEDRRPPAVYKPPRELEPITPRRVRYRCIKAHSLHGRFWEVGEIWDSRKPDYPEPPAGSEDWEVYNPADDDQEPVRPSGGLQPTRS